jgi:xanthine dehydrogenase accessory factor
MLEARAAELRAARVPYVHARVVLAEPPTSAKPGAEALVLPDGTIEGFVGGTCAESTVRAQGLALLDSGESLLLRITPTPEPDQSGMLVVHNPCLSGGTLEIFLEPVMPAPVIVVAGSAPVAEALRALAVQLGWRVGDNGDQGELAGASALVVASHGRDEESALRAGIEADVPYVGLVASRKRAEAVIGSLGLCAGHTARIHSPAGLDIGARTPPEIALSIMSEIVSLRPRPSGRPVAETVPTADTAIDPVCGMTVSAVESSLHLDHDGRRVWFCGSGCLRAFAADPEAYTSS